MLFEEIIAIVKAALGDDAIDGVDEKATPKAIFVKPEHLLQVCQLLHTKEGLYFDMLSCVTGIDNGVDANTMEMVYNLYSIPYEHSLMIKVILDRQAPIVPSLVDIWKTADWHERETYDLLGISFSGHPDLRRLLMPADWEGHPLRKDYENPEYYRGVKVQY